MFTFSMPRDVRSSRRHIFLVILVLMAAALWLRLASAQPVSPLTGTWHGKLIAAQFDPLDIVLHISVTGHEDTYAATLDIPTQFRHGLPVTSISIKNNNILVSIPSLDAEFFGSLMFDAEGLQVIALNGDWSQSGEHIPLRLERSN